MHFRFGHQHGKYTKIVKSIATTEGLVAGRLSVQLDVMSKIEQLPACISNFVTSIKSITAIDGLVAGRLSVQLDAMSKIEQLPECISDLVTSMASIPKILRASPRPMVLSLGV